MINMRALSPPAPTRWWTPINDSFVDFDLIGQVDAETFKVKRLSFYAELIWEARKARAKSDGVTIDWVVVRNRLHNMEARNQQRMRDAIADLSKRVGFRTVPGLNERVIYRELFPAGLTLIDKGHLGQLGTAHIAARQELRELVAGLNLPDLHSNRLVLMLFLAGIIVAALAWGIMGGQRSSCRNCRQSYLGWPGLLWRCAASGCSGYPAIVIGAAWFQGMKMEAVWHTGPSKAMNIPSPKPAVCSAHLRAIMQA